LIGAFGPTLMLATGEKRNILAALVSGKVSIAMRLSLISVLVLAAAVAASTPVLCTIALADKRVALVIGNSAYKKVPQLSNPVNDAQAVGEVFRAAGFDVIDIRHDLDAQGLRRAIRDFSLVVRDADVAVVFYAGHGIELDGNNYLVPIDAKLALDVDVEDETVSLDRVLKIIEPAKRLRLVILDACRGNPFAASMKRTVATRSIGRGLAKVEPMTSDTLIAFAAKAGSLAEDGRGPHSPFTSALLKHLPVPGLDVRFAFGRVRDEVWKSTGYQQEPSIYGSLGGDTVSIVPAVPEPPPARVPDPDAVAWDEITWDLVKDSKDAEQLRRFVEQFPTTPRRTDAEQRIAALAAEAAQEAKRPPAEIGPRELARALQLELKRVGCFVGAVDGEFGSITQTALRNFAKYAATRLLVCFIRRTAAPETRSTCYQLRARLRREVNACGVRPLTRMLHSFEDAAVR
jgi:Caspase domain